MFKCDVCLYETNRKFNLQQHNSRKKKCKPVEIPINVMVDSKSNGLECTNSKGEEDLVVVCMNKCNKCYKEFASKASLRKHAKTCVGIKTIHCPTCLKVFASKQTKYEHRKNVNCKPPIDLPENWEEQCARLLKENKLKDKEIQNMKATKYDTEYIQLEEKENAALKK